MKSVRDSTLCTPPCLYSVFRDVEKRFRIATSRLNNEEKESKEHRQISFIRQAELSKTSSWDKDIFLQKGFFQLNVLDLKEQMHSRIFRPCLVWKSCGVSKEKSEQVKKWSKKTFESQIVEMTFWERKHMTP